MTCFCVSGEGDGVDGFILPFGDFSVILIGPILLRHETRRFAGSAFDQLCLRNTTMCVL